MMAIHRIDTEKCVGCGACVNSCSMDVIRFEDLRAGHDILTFCRSACPAGVDMRSYISLLLQDRIEEAIRVIRAALPLPAVTGHVCFHPCEEECARREVDEAVNINALERYVADYWLQEKAKPVPALYNEKVAVVGSGPAGLAAAYELVRAGYPVTVFERESEPGGMLRYGIPEYRLPVKLLDAQIEYIRGLGVVFMMNSAFGKEMILDDLKRQGYRAVLIAIGAQLSRKLDIGGAQLENVLWGLDFLKEAKLNRRVHVPERVVVVGGGDAAMDSALTALRLGAESVKIVCLELREEMPAHEEAIRMAEEEGIEIQPGWGPKEVIGRKGRVTGIRFVRCQSVFDGAGAFKPSFDEDIRRMVEADMVVFAIGESTDLRGLPEGVETRMNYVKVDPVTMATSLPGVFSAGVVASGPGLVVEAIASGKRAAASIDRYLRDNDGGGRRKPDEVIVRNPPCKGVEKRPRHVNRFLPVAERKGNFREIKLGFDQEAAEREARRCMACGSKATIRYFEDCMTCYSCERDCPEEAIYVSPEHVPQRISSWG